LSFTEFFVAAELAMVFDDESEEGVGGAGCLETLFAGVERNRTLRCLDVVGLVNFLLAELDVYT
jgi:hypothetical protein